ncbi:MAG: hypothetical protein PHX57_09430, partial [Desulfobulbaceae bacterium]|nr:hypothetical protein [Desulfobulbaceae bacterium]
MTSFRKGPNPETNIPGLKSIAEKRYSKCIKKVSAVKYIPNCQTGAGSGRMDEKKGRKYFFLSLTLLALIFLPPLLPDASVSLAGEDPF